MLTESRKIYVASSRRNSEQPAVVKALRGAGHEVYDFHNPAPGENGFAWSALDPDWLKWNLRQYVHNVRKPLADKGFKFDRDALHWCDTCVLVLPCGRSAHLEAGYAAGRKFTRRLRSLRRPSDIPSDLKAPFTLGERQWLRKTTCKTALKSFKRWNCPASRWVCTWARCTSSTICGERFNACAHQWWRRRTDSDFG